MARSKKTTSLPNPLNAGMPSIPLPGQTVTPDKMPENLKPSPEQTGQQNTIYNSMPWMMGIPGMPGAVGSTPGAGAFFGSMPLPQPVGNAVQGPFYNGFGQYGLNQFGMVVGSWSNYWYMERNPTVALAEAAADAPVKAAEITYECREGCPQEVVDFIRGQFKDHERFVLDILTLARGSGCRQMELVYKIKNGRFEFDHAKALAPELTTAIRDEHGNLVGLENQGVELNDARRFIWTVYDGKGINPYGRSRKENCKQPWLLQQALYGMLEYSMNVQVRPFGYVTYPYGLTDTDGTSLNNKMQANAAQVANQLASAQWALVPDPFAKWAEEMVQKGIDPSKIMPYKIGWYDKTGSDGLVGFERGFSITDRGIVMGILQPPRTILEGPGTQADAGQHTDTGVKVNEIFLESLCAEWSHGPIDTVLVQNFGEDYRGAVWWKPSPLVDKQLDFNNELVKQMLGGPVGPILLQRVVKIASILEKSGVNIDDFDQDELFDEFEAQQAEQRKMDLEDTRAEKEPIKASLVDSENRLTDEESKRRKQFLLALLAFFAFQAEAIKTQPGIKADDDVFNKRLMGVLFNGMLPAHLSPTSGATVLREIHKQALRIAEKINGSTAKNAALVLEGVEDRAAKIEDDMDHLGRQIEVQVIEEVAQNEIVWRTQEGACKICQPLNGIVVKAGEEFAPGIRYPVIDTHSACRCVVEKVEASV